MLKIAICSALFFTFTCNSTTTTYFRAPVSSIRDIKPITHRCFFQGTYKCNELDVLHYIHLPLPKPPPPHQRHPPPQTRLPAAHRHAITPPRHRKKRRSKIHGCTVTDISPRYANLRIILVQSTSLDPAIWPL